MKLYCIGIGPGGEEQMTLRAVRALEKCDCVAGYGLYLDLIENLISDKERIESGMTREVLRCKAAVEAAKQGKTVAVVSSGDAGVYGMASLLLELGAGIGDGHQMLHHFLVRDLVGQRIAHSSQRQARLDGAARF